MLPPRHRRPHRRLVSTPRINLLYQPPTHRTVMNSALNTSLIRPSRLCCGTFFLATALLCTLAGTVRAQTPVLQINAGGGAVPPFVADTGFNTGNSFSSTAAISLAGATNPAPAAVYQSVRWAPTFNYTLGGLTAGESYLVRLHFVELTFPAPGPRTFNVAINGARGAGEFQFFPAPGHKSPLHPGF